MPRQSASHSPDTQKRGDTAPNLPAQIRLTTMPPVPEGFGDVGRAHWNLYCGMYLKMNNLSLAWLPVITNICEQHEYLALIKSALDSQGVIVLEWKPDREGELVPRSVCNPLYRDYLKACNQLHSHLNDMGGTPYSSKIATVGMGTASDLAPKKGNKPAINRPIPLPSLEAPIGGDADAPIEEA